MGYIFGSMFGQNQAPADNTAVEAMDAHINKVGGLLHFTVTTDADGWSAQCDEIEEIITGGSNPNPADSEIKDNIREAIHTAFHITSKNIGIRSVEKKSDVQALYTVAAV